MGGRAAMDYYPCVFLIEFCFSDAKQFVWLANWEGHEIRKSFASRSNHQKCADGKVISGIVTLRSNGNFALSVP